MAINDGVIVRGFSRQQDVLLGEAMALVARNASREELLKFFVVGFANQSLCNAAVVVEAIPPDEFRHRPHWELRGLCHSGVQEVRWKNFCQYLKEETSSEHWLTSLVKRQSEGALISRLMASELGDNEDVYRDIKRIVDEETMHLWLSILRLPSSAVMHPTRFVLVVYRTTADAVPHGGEQDWRLLELFRGVYNLALADLRQKAKKIVDHRRELMRDLAPSILHHEINSRVVNSVRTLEQLSTILAAVVSPHKADLEVLCQSLSLDIETLRRITHAVMGLERKPGNEDVSLITELGLLKDLTLFRLNKIGGIMTIRCDDSQRITSSSALLLHVLVNLVNNAVDALTPLKEADNSFLPEIAIEVSHWHLPVGDRRSSKPGVAIQVIDNGPGINTAQQGHLFDVGFTTKKSGHGLGLPISRLLAGFLGGSLEYIRRPNVSGSCFQLTLPAEAPITEAIERELEDLLNA